MAKDQGSAESRLHLPEYRGHGIVELTGFACLVLFVAAAMGGAFGDGPASNATGASGDGSLQVEYQRFCRRHAPQEIRVTVPTQRGVNHVELTFNSEYLRRVQITEIAPQPQQATAQSEGRLRFVTDGSGTPLTVQLHVQAQRAGFQQAVVSVARHGDVQLKQFVYP